MPARRRAAELTTSLRRLALPDVKAELSKLPRSLPELTQRLQQQIPTPNRPRVLSGDFRAAQAMLARLSVPFGAAAAASAGGTAGTAAVAAAPVAAVSAQQQASVASRLLIQLLGTRRGVALAASAEQFGLNDVNLLKAAVSLAYIINRPPGVPLPLLAAAPSAAGDGAAAEGSVGGDGERPAELPHDAAHWARVAAAAYATTQRDLLRALGPSFAPTDVLLAQLETRDLQPAHMLMVDRMHRALVFAVRGTAALTDVLTDVTGATVDLVTGETLAPLARQLGDSPDDAGDAATGGDGRLHLGGHGGIAACTEQFVTVRFSDAAVPVLVEALNRLPPAPTAAADGGAGAVPAAVSEADIRDLLQDAYRSGLSGVAALLHVLRSLRHEYRDWPVLFVGHSLGAAVAAMLASFTRVAVAVATERAAGRLAPELVASLDAAAAAAREESAAAAAAAADGDGDGGAYRHEPLSDDVGSMELPSLSKAVAVAASRLDSPRSRPLLPQLSGTDALRLLHSSRAPVFAVVFACPPCLTPEAAALLQLSQAQLQALPWGGGGDGGSQPAPSPEAPAEPASPAAADVTALWRFPRHASTQRHSHGHAGDPHQWAQRPLVTVCVLGDDMIPRTTLASVRALHDQLTDPALAAEASAHALRELQQKAEGVKDTVAGRLREAQAWFDGNIRTLREQVARLQLPQSGMLAAGTAAGGDAAGATASLASRLPSVQQLLPQLPSFPPPALPLQGALSREAVTEALEVLLAKLPPSLVPGAEALLRRELTGGVSPAAALRSRTPSSASVRSVRSARSGSASATPADADADVSGGSSNEDVDDEDDDDDAAGHARHADEDDARSMVSAQSWLPGDDGDELDTEEGWSDAHTAAGGPLSSVAASDGGAFAVDDAEQHDVAATAAAVDALAAAVDGLQLAGGDGAPPQATAADAHAFMRRFRRRACLPSQPLVVPGVIYHVVRGAPASAAAAAADTAAAATAAATVPAAAPSEPGASVTAGGPLQPPPASYAVTVCRPSSLAAIRVSPTMVSDHEMREICRAVTAVMLRGGTSGSH
jgi:trimeric autotransporter adhesin